MVNYSGTYATPRLDLGVAFMEHTLDLKGFVAGQVLPVFRTQKKAASFSAAKRAALLQDPAAERAPRSGYNRINTQFADESYSCPEYGLEHVVDDSERSLYASDFDAEAIGAKVLARALMLKWEKRAAAAVFDATTSWPSGDSTLYTDITTVWSDAAATIIADIRAAKTKIYNLTGITDDLSLIVNKVNFDYLFANTQILGRMTSAIVTGEEQIRQNLANILGVKKIVVAGEMRNSAIEGAAFSGAAVWSSSYAMVARLAEPGDPLDTPCIGRSFLWVPDSPNEITTEMYREEQARGDVLRARHSMDELIIDPSFGHLLKVD